MTGEAPKPFRLSDHLVVHEFYFTNIRASRFCPSGEMPSEKKVFTPKVESADSYRMLGENRCLVKLDVKISFESPPTPPFEMELSSVFEGEISVPEEMRGPILQRSAYSILWPYCREAISRLSTRLGFPPLYLPVILVAPLLNKRQETPPEKAS